MSAFTGGMDDVCPACQRTVGDHTMREFEVCTKSRAFEIAYSPASKRTLNERFNLPADVLVADHFVAKATVLSGSAGPLQLQLAGLLLEFATSETGAVDSLAKVLFVSDPAQMRKAARLLRDTANGAANAAEK